MRARSCAVVIGGGLMYLAAAHMDAVGATIATPHSEYRPAFPLIVVRHVQNTGDGDLDAMMRQQFAQAQAQMEAAMREMQQGFNHIPATSWSEHHSTTRRQVFRGQERDDDDDGDDQARPSPPAPQPVVPSPTRTESPDDNSIGWGACIMGLASIAFMAWAAMRCIRFCRDLFSLGAVGAKPPTFAAPAGAAQPAWPYQPSNPTTHPAWSPRPGGPVIYDIPE